VGSITTQKKLAKPLALFVYDAIFHLAAMVVVAQLLLKAFLAPGAFSAFWNFHRTQKL